jgi:branched-chain amino acid transport system ATP-binding protein
VRPEARPTAPLLELRDITAGYGETTVLREVSLSVPAGGGVAVLGPNGAGKTTLLRVASGLLRPRRGRVYLDGADVTTASPAERMRRGLCHIPDPRGIFSSLTVKENLLLQAPKGRAREAADVAVQTFPRLGQRMSQLAGTLSGGEQQMLAVARAYVQEPRVVLLDEVSMGLAPSLVDEIFEFLQRLANNGVALVIVEQFMHRALALAAEVAVMARGSVTLSGGSDAFTEDEIFAAYASRERASAP